MQYPIIDGVEYAEVGRYDANGTWFTYADINGVGLTEHSHECALLPMGPWIGRAFTTPIDRHIDDETRRELARQFYQYNPRWY